MKIKIFLILQTLLLAFGMMTLQACFEEQYSGRGPGYGTPYGYASGYSYAPGYYDYRDEHSYGPRQEHESLRERHEEQEHEHGERD
jgi:hypothetical protein